MDNLETYLFLPLPIPLADLSIIQEKLETEGMFCTLFPEEEIYSVGLYHLQASLHDTETSILIDRNLFGRIVDLARG